MSNKNLVSLCALIMSACAGTPESNRAAGAATAGEPQAASAGQDEWETYCKQEKVLGSNLPERVCYRRRVTESQ